MGREADDILLDCPFESPQNGKRDDECGNAKHDPHHRKKSDEGNESAVASGAEITAGNKEGESHPWGRGYFLEKASSFLHIDSDLYSSARTVLFLLHEQIVSGTIIEFDEYFNYPNWKQHEYKAFQ